MEELANAFALAFLMPEKEYRVVVSENTANGVVDTKAVAEHFHVSISDASARGVSLGLLRAW